MNWFSIDEEEQICPFDHNTSHLKVCAAVSPGKEGGTRSQTELAPSLPHPLIAASSRPHHVSSLKPGFLLDKMHR